MSKSPRIPPDLCSGCGVCSLICPKNAIRFRVLTNGYIRPLLDPSNCINCYLCEKVCPFLEEPNSLMSRGLYGNKENALIGKYLKVVLAWSTNKYVRFMGSSGGVITSLLIYLLRKRHIDAVVVPKLHVINGRVFGVYEVVTDPAKLIEYSGSIYAPIFGVHKALKEVSLRKSKIAIVAPPCLIRGLRNAMRFNPRLRNSIRYVLGVYCNNMPSASATEYVMNTFLNNVSNVNHVRFRGFGWPGYLNIRTVNGRSFRIKFQEYYDSGFGQYFYDYSCFMCNDHTAELADISFADPWTYQVDIGLGKTLVVIRTAEGWRVFREAVEEGYIEYRELPSFIYAVQFTTLLKKTLRGFTLLSKHEVTRGNYVLPPSISTIVHEIDYRVGHFLALNKRLWNFLRMYVKLKPYVYLPLIALDYKLKTRWTQILMKIVSTWKIGK